jgi:hypothetical protein
VTIKRISCLVLSSFEVGIPSDVRHCREALLSDHNSTAPIGDFPDHLA